MTADETKKLLEIIEVRLKSEADVFSRPILCSALNPDIITDEEYQQIKDYNFKYSIPTTNKKKLVIPTKLLNALVLLFIRNFFERGRGNDPWKSSVGFEEKEQRDTFKELLLSGYMRWEKSNLKGNDIRVGWLPYHCWLLKAEERGDTCFRIKNNARLIKQLKDEEQEYNIFQCAWENLLEQTPIELINENRPAGAYFNQKDIPDYLIALWENAGEDLLYSMKALMSSEEEKPRDFYYAKWLEKIWGLGLQGELSREVKEVAQKFINVRHPKAEWSLIRQSSYRILLTLWPSKATKIIVRQGECQCTLSPNGQPVMNLSVEHLTKLKIRCEEKVDIIFTYEKEHDIVLSVPPLSQTLSFYNVRKLGSRMSMVKDGCRSAQAAICVLSATAEEPDVTFAGKVCRKHPIYEKDNRICGDAYQGHEYRCCVYRLREESSEINRGTLCINSEIIADLAFIPTLQITAIDEQAECILDGEDKESQKWEIVLGNSAKLEWTGSSITQIPLAPGSNVADVHMEKLTEQTWKISVEKSLFDEPLCVVCQSGTAKRKKTIFFISPNEWKERSIRCDLETERDYAASYKEVYRYTTKSGQSLLLSRPLQETKLYWKEGKTLSPVMGVRDINDLQNPVLQLEVWAPLGDESREEVVCHGTCKEYVASLSRCTFIENVFAPTLGDKVTFKVNGCTIASGEWKPRKAYFWDSDYIYAHPTTRSERCVRLVTGSDLKAFAIGEKRQLEPSFLISLADLEYDDDYLAALPANLPKDEYAVLLIVKEDEDEEESYESIAERRPMTCRAFLESIGALGVDEHAKKVRQRLKRSFKRIHREYQFQMLSELPIEAQDEINLPEAYQELYEEFTDFRQGWAMFIGEGAVMTDSGELKDKGTPLPIAGLMTLYLDSGHRRETISKLCVATARIVSYQDAAPKPYIFYNSECPILDTARLVPITKQGKLDATRGKMLIFNKSADFSEIRECLSQWIIPQQSPRLEANGLACLGELEERFPQNQKSVFKMLRSLHEQMIQGGQITEAAYLLTAVVMALITQEKKTEWKKLEKYPPAVTRPLVAAMKDMDTNPLQRYYTFVRWALLCFTSR